MKTNKLLVIAVAAISLVACSNGIIVNPTSQKINGPLGKFFEIVERDYKIFDGELGVEFKRMSEGGPNNASLSTNPTFLVELQDEDGNTISTEHTDIITTKEQLESVFALAVDESTSILFKFDKTEGASKFKISSKWDDSNDESSKTQRKLNLADDNYIFAGYWQSNKYESQPCNVVFEKRGNNLHNTKYINLKFGVTIPLMGRIENDSLVFEGEIQGKPFYIHLSGDENRLSGKGNDLAHQDMNVTLDLNRTEEEGSTTYLSGDIIDDNGDSSYDEFFEEYERFWRKYINFIKKMDKNDPSAMVEYAQLLQEYQRYSDKLTKIKGQLSVSQINRLNKMNAELIEEMSKIQH